jgi:hypothetical protein
MEKGINMTDEKRCEPAKHLRGVDVVGYEGLYTVDTNGTIVSVATGRGRVTGRVLKASPKPPKGYWRVNLWDGTKQQNAYVHHIVAAAFLGPRPNGMLVLHADGDKSNNRLGNLRYGTHVENVADAKRHGTFAPGKSIGEKHGQSKLTALEVAWLRQLQSPNFTALAASLGVSRKTVHQAYHRETWRHV